VPHRQDRWAVAARTGRLSAHPSVLHAPPHRLRAVGGAVASLGLVGARLNEGAQIGSRGGPLLASEMGRFSRAPKAASAGVATQWVRRSCCATRLTVSSWKDSAAAEMNRNSVAPTLPGRPLSPSVRW
jgi:hypothetical protein